MSPDDALAAVRAMVFENGQKVFIRRYRGTGPSRTFSDSETMAYVRFFDSRELIGSIVQGDQVAVTLIDTLSAILPVTTSDKLVPANADGTPGSDEYAIKNPHKRIIGGVLIALEIHASG